MTDNMKGSGITIPYPRRQDGPAPAQCVRACECVCVRGKMVEPLTREVDVSTGVLARWCMRFPRSSPSVPLSATRLCFWNQWRVVVVVVGGAVCDDDDGEGIDAAAGFEEDDDDDDDDNDNDDHHLCATAMILS